MHRQAKIKRILIFPFLIIIDQFIKYQVRTSGGFYICNPNIAFDLTFEFFFISLSVLLFFLLLFNFKFKIFNLKSISNFKFQISNFSNLQIFSIALILSGAISNMIDRLCFGCVIDFINIHIWPVFNLADIYITIGAILLIMEHTTHSMEQKKK